MEFVYSANDGDVLNNVSGGNIRMRPNDIWFADDPFVVARPDLFSATPLVVHSTTGRAAPPATPVELTKSVVLGAGEDVTEFALAAPRRGRPRRA